MTRLPRLLVSGGIQRSDAELMNSVSGTHYHRGRLVEVDLEAGSERVLLDYETPAGARPEQKPGIRFTGMTLDNGRLYLCTGTEIMIHSWPGMELLQYATHPHFHDIHHAAPVNGEIVVTLTGLDAVAFLNAATLEPVRYVNTASVPLWERFDPSRDWRMVHSTQPHEAHPNFIFELDGAPWVTRGNRSDAMCLEDPALTVSLGEQCVHDGICWGDCICFTSVDGTLIVYDVARRQIMDVIDLKTVERTGTPLGWCRGLCIEDGVAYVGYTTLRTTRWKGNVEVFLNQKTGEYKQVLPSRVCAYDLTRREKLSEFVFPRDSIGAVFGVVIADSRRAQT